MSAPQVEFGFVAALEREVSGLVRDWSRTKAQSADASWPIYCNQRAALILAGTGAERARTAAKLLIEKFAPRVLISIGFAGSCRPDLRPGELMVPESLVEASTGRTCHCAFGQGQLVTLDRVAGKGLKQQAAARFGAWAVDMEAAGVAAAAAESSMDFAAIKAISDGSGEGSRFPFQLRPARRVRDGTVHGVHRHAAEFVASGCRLARKQQTGGHGFTECGRRVHARPGDVCGPACACRFAGLTKERWLRAMAVIPDPRSSAPVLASIPERMLAVIYHGQNDMRLETVAVPGIGAGELLVRIHTCGICGTDTQENIDRVSFGAAGFWS